MYVVVLPKKIILNCNNINLYFLNRVMISPKKRNLHSLSNYKNKIQPAEHVFPIALDTYNLSFP